jgi:rRNA maturation endonuclease Nob1
MKASEIKDYYVDYKKECENCKKIVTLKTQADECPEYYTTVYILCVCGDYVNFVLPVN